MGIRKWALPFWVFFIFLLSPLARGVQGLARDLLGKNGIAAMLVLVCLLLLFAGLRYLKRGSLSFSRTCLLFVALFPLAGLLYTLRGNPEEVFHVLEYGFLSFLFLQAEAEGGCWSAYLAGCLASSVGVVEELFQWVLPNRIFDFRDIGINLFAAFLVQVLLWGLAPTPLRSIPPSQVPRMVSATLLLCSLLFICVLLSPERLQEMSEIFPILASLENEAKAGAGEAGGGIDLIYGYSRIAILQLISGLCFILILARLSLLRGIGRREFGN